MGGGGGGHMGGGPGAPGMGGGAGGMGLTYDCPVNKVSSLSTQINATRVYIPRRSRKCSTRYQGHINCQCHQTSAVFNQKRRFSRRNLVSFRALNQSRSLSLSPPEPCQVGLVIGRGGETIKRLQSETGAHIHVDRENGKVLLRGTNEACDRVRRELDELLGQGPGGGGGGQHGGGHGGGGDQHVMSSGGQEGRLIGRGGENIKRMQAESGARIQVSELRAMRGESAPGGPESCSVSIKGFCVRGRAEGASR